MDAAKWASTVGHMLIGAEYGLNVNSTEADFRSAAERIMRDAKDQQGVTLSNVDGLAAALKGAIDDRKSW